MVPVLAAAGGCGEADPMARTDDLWPGHKRAATEAFPSGAAVEAACGRATMYLKEVAERTPGTYVDLDLPLADHPVRNVRCRWEPGSAATAFCRFETTPVSTERDRAAELRRHGLEWSAMEARLVHVGGEAGWIAPEGCAQAAPTGR
jgi:hypothetical protein